MWDWFIDFLMQILQWLANFSGDWGIAVIILTIIIRLLVMPLMTKSTASSARMQALQPKMMEIQNKYADDPERQAEELRKFTAENKFNPLGGCLSHLPADARLLRTLHRRQAGPLVRSLPQHHAVPWHVCRAGNG